MTRDAAQGNGALSPRLEALAAAVGTAPGRGPAPVDTWHPPFHGDIDMRIAADGTWFYAGSKITRPALVALFAGILRKDPKRYVLVTPAECVGIEVEDAPFIAVAMTEADGALAFATNCGDTVRAGAEHPLRFARDAADGLKPYVHVRGGLWARLTRSLALDLIDRGETRDHDGAAMFGVASGGTFFPIEADVGFDKAASA